MKKNQAPAKKASGTNKKKRTKAIIIVASMVVALAAIVGVVTAANWDEYQQYAADRKTVAVCNGYDIPYEELRFVTMYYKDYLEGIHGKGLWDDPVKAEEYRDELEKLVRDNLNANYVVLSACRQMGIATDSSDLNKQVDADMSDLRDEFNTRADYLAFLEESYLTEHYCEFTLKISLLQSVLHETMLAENLYTYSHKNVDEYIDYVLEGSDYVRVIYIAIDNNEGDDKEANLAKVQKLSDELQAIADPDRRLAQMRESIASFDESKDDATGQGVYFTYGEMDEIFEKAAFELEIGEVSDPVVCSGANFVLMRLEPDENYVASNVTTLLNNFYGVNVSRYIDQFRPQCDVAFTEYGKTIDLVAMN